MTIKELRFEKRLTQEELAKRVGISQALLSKYERGCVVPPQHIIKRLADALDVVQADISTEPIKINEEDKVAQSEEIGYWRGDLKLSEMGERIREVRKQQNLSRSQLALFTNINPHYLYEIEKGKKAPSVTILYRIAKVLGVSTNYLLMESKNTETDELDKLLEKLSAKSRENLSAILIELLNLTREGQL